MGSRETASTFAKVIAVVMLLFLLIAAIVGVSNWRVQAQGAPATTQIATYSIRLFTNQAVPAASNILRDIGQGTNILTVCNSNFIGSVDLEWEPQGTTTFLPLQTAQYNSDSGCPHTIVVGGYYPNLRARVVTTAGGNTTINYTASAAPVHPVPAGISSNGPTPPPVCDQQVSSAFPTGGTNTVGVLAAAPNQITVFCGFTISYTAAPTGGNVNFNWVTPPTLCSTGSGVQSWSMSIPSTLTAPVVVPLPQRSPIPNQLTQPCFTNNSGATALVTVSYATISST
jgi:hypothetical protein